MRSSKLTKHVADRAPPAVGECCAIRSRKTSSRITSVVASEETSGRVDVILGPRVPEQARSSNVAMLAKRFLIFIRLSG